MTFFSDGETIRGFSKIVIASSQPVNSCVTIRPNVARVTTTRIRGMTPRRFMRERVIPYNPPLRMTATSEDVSAPTSPAPAWRLSWLSPALCWVVLAVVLLLGFFSHVQYLNHNCPIDLSGDEAQYWDWSRRLDLSYYSKGPLVAYLIRASCAIFGETMPAVRYPAILLGAGTSLFAYLLTRKLFGSDRLALGAVLLSNLVPIMIFGQIFMTIDAP